jgi:hypothetical protein
VSDNVLLAQVLLKDDNVLLRFECEEGDGKEIGKDNGEGNIHGGG